MGPLPAILLSLAGALPSDGASVDGVEDPGLAATSTLAAAAPESAVRARVENRLFQKSERVFVRLGLTYLAREDYWLSPGLTLEGGYAFSEQWALDASASVWASTLEASAKQLREQYGLLPDAQQPIARIVVGPRFSWAYGKMLIEELGWVLHFDLSVMLRVGGMITDQTFNPGGDLGLALQVGLDRNLIVFAEVAGWLGYEERTSGALSGGPHATVGLGWGF